MRTIFVLLMLSACIQSDRAWSQTDSYVDPNQKAAVALCKNVEGATPPAGDQPTQAQRAKLGGCDGEALLYGIGTTADPVRARLCAFVQLFEPTTDLIDGNGLLMTIYANGLGVPTNRAIAIHLACTGVSSATAELYGRVVHIAALPQTTGSKILFSPCDDGGSGFSESVCASHDSRIAELAFEQRVDRFARFIPETTTASFNALRRAQAAWTEARPDEMDQSGSFHGAFDTADQDRQRTDFADMLDRLRRSPPPRLGARQLRAAETRMNDALSVLLSPGNLKDIGTISADGIRHAQAAWIAYREAWSRFAALAYPTLGANGAAAWVTMKRADMLERM